VKTVELKVEAVALDWKGEPVVVLREAQGQRAVFIWIGVLEASAISLPLGNETAPRPLTHDLIVKILEELQAEVTRVVISDVQDVTYYAALELTTTGNRSISIDCRPSDAIAIALRTNAPLFIDADLLERLEEAQQEVQQGQVTLVPPGEPTVH
jgi:uncharacterized protein